MNLITGPPIVGKLGEYVCITLLTFMLCTGTSATPLLGTFASPVLSLNPKGSLDTLVITTDEEKNYE